LLHDFIGLAELNKAWLRARLSTHHTLLYTSEMTAFFVAKGPRKKMHIYLVPYCCCRLSSLIFLRLLLLSHFPTIFSKRHNFAENLAAKRHKLITFTPLSIYLISSTLYILQLSVSTMTMFTALYIVLYGVYYLLSLPRCCWLPRLIPAHTALSLSLSLSLYMVWLCSLHKSSEKEVHSRCCLFSTMRAMH
jgi:hypothetical protein